MTIDRRSFLAGTASLVAWPARANAQDASSVLQSYERDTGGRIGLYAENLATGAKIVWRSVPTGRGMVTEKVGASLPGKHFQTQVLEERLTATQTVDFESAEEGGTAVILALDYTLVRKGPLAWLTDVLFIRRAQNDALARTLRRFATEAAEQAAL